MEQQIIQLVSGIEVKASERLMIVRFLDAIAFDGEEDGTHVKEVCKLAFEPELAQVLLQALQKFLARQAGKKMSLDILSPLVIQKDAYCNIDVGSMHGGKYSSLPDEIHRSKPSVRYMPLREFVIPDKGSDKSKRLIRKYQGAEFLLKAMPMLMENDQIAALYLGDDISATVVFQNDQWVNIAMHKRGERKAMLTAKAHFSQSENPAKLLDKLLGLFDDGR